MKAKESIPDRAGIGNISIAALIYQRSILEMVNEITDAGTLRQIYTLIEGLCQWKEEHHA